MSRMSLPGERVWEEKTQDMEETCMFWGSCESFLVTEEAGDRAAK